MEDDEETETDEEEETAPPAKRKDFPLKHPPGIHDIRQHGVYVFRFHIESPLFLDSWGHTRAQEFVRTHARVMQVMAQVHGSDDVKQSRTSSDALCFGYPRSTNLTEKRDGVWEHADYVLYVFCAE